MRPTQMQVTTGNGIHLAQHWYTIQQFFHWQQGSTVATLRLFVSYCISLFTYTRDTVFQLILQWYIGTARRISIMLRHYSRTLVTTSCC